MTTFSKKIRVRASQGEAMATALRGAGFEAQFLGPGTAHTSLHLGCSDSLCCPQHRAADAPQEWGAIQTNVGGNKAHRVWVALGLV